MAPKCNAHVLVVWLFQGQQFEADVFTVAVKMRKTNLEHAPVRVNAVINWMHASQHESCLQTPYVK